MVDRHLILPNTFKTITIYEWDRLQMDMNNNNSLVKFLCSKIEKLEKELDELKTRVDYMPGNVGYLVAKQDFEELSKTETLHICGECGREINDDLIGNNFSLDVCPECGQEYITELI